LRAGEASAAEFVPFTAQTRMSGVDLPGRRLRKGRGRRHRSFVAARGAPSRPRSGAVDEVAREGGTPLVVADGAACSGWCHLKDVVKGGIRSASPSCAAWASAR
jgi:K+-transporting ATPase ATPase B chain